MQLPKIEKVELREVWKHETLDFTNWLAKPENLELLSNEIGIDLTLIETGASVGKLNVDILAEKKPHIRKIVIKNQLESTDYNHLGKMIAYASGFDAEIIIWIAKNVRDEHKQAVDWLNAHTDINILVIQIEVWKIFNSPCVPKFQIVAKPKDWAKVVQKVTKLSDLKLLQLEFWKSFKEFVQTNNGKIKLRKPFPQHWYNISFGFSSITIDLTLNTQLRQMACEIYIPNSKQLFLALYEHKKEIEKNLSSQLDWRRLPKRKASRIILKTECAFFNQDNWNTYHLWMLEKATNFQQVFSTYIKQYRN